MRSLLIDVFECEVKEVHISNFTDFYSHLHCRCFDVAGRTVGEEKRYYDIFVDDAGMLKSTKIVSAVNSAGQPMLVGNLVITRTAQNGEQLPLDDDDIKYLRFYVRTGLRMSHDGVVPYPVLCNVEYS